MKVNRIDIIKTIEQIDFGPETWEWLELMGTIAGESQKEAMIQEKGFRADTPYKKYLLCAINKDLQTINATYFLLRCEIIHQAASHVRLFCESLITMQYVAIKREPRAAQFWDFRRSTKVRKSSFNSILACQDIIMGVTSPQIQTE